MIDTAKVRADHSRMFALDSDPQTAAEAESIRRLLSSVVIPMADEIDRLRADVAAMLPIVEAVAAISADHCCGLDCLHDDARRFLDARKVRT